MDHALTKAAHDGWPARARTSNSIDPALAGPPGVQDTDHSAAHEELAGVGDSPLANSTVSAFTPLGRNLRDGGQADAARMSSSAPSVAWSN